MREILFRGKHIGNGEWFKGGIFHNPEDDIFFIIKDTGLGYHEFIEVVPETVGQFTGLYDKNGTKIFEGDMFRMDDECVADIIFKDGLFQFQVWGLCGTYTESGYDECGGGWGIIERVPLDMYYTHDMEVIGNIHDNPELLEGETE